MNRPFLYVILFALCATSACEDAAGPMLPDNSPPTIEGLQDTTATIGQTLVMDFVVSDPDGDHLEFSFGHLATKEDLAGGYHPQAGVNLDRNFFWFSPNERDGSAQVFYFSADDGAGGRTTVRFQVEIFP